MKAVVAAFNQEKALVGAFSVNTNPRMELFEALVSFRLVRVETVCQEPRLTIYHDLVTAAEIRYMKAAVLRDLMVATTVDTEDSSGDGKKVSNERTQSSGWLWEQASSRGVNEISQVLVYLV